MNIILFEEETNVIMRNDERYKHIRKILKLKVGDTFECGFVNRSSGKALITEFTDERIVFEYTQEKGPDRMNPVTLLTCQVRPICMRRILREAVSMGVGRIILSGSDLTEKSYMEATLYTTGEYKSILMDGAMQSGENGLPEVVFTKTLDKAISSLSSSSQLIMLDNVVGAIPLSKTDVVKDDVVLAIGPERGFSDRERKLLENSGFAPVLLGSRILRTETACSAGLAVLYSRMGLM